MSFLWKIGGEAGFGIMTGGLVLSKIASRSGYHIYDYAEYPSLIRGGHNTYDVEISDKPIFSIKNTVDLLVCLNEETYQLHKSRLTKDSVVAYDNTMFTITDEVQKAEVPFLAILKELKGAYLMLNTTALGVSLGLMGGDISMLYEMIEDQFTKKSENVVAYNKQFALKGFEGAQVMSDSVKRAVLTKRTAKEKVVLGGNDAFSLASAVGDCRFYAAYPMTPSSAVLSILAGWQEKTGMVVRHAEDEIAVINSALGASHSGVRAAVGTSGGGFALMVEAISYAGIAEIPLVIFLGQRPGPATGMPTWTEQGDLLFACHAGHGEFPKIVLAPGDAYEMLELTLKAYDLADIYQVPVIVMGDKVLCESHSTPHREEVGSLLANYHPHRGKTVREPSEQPYLRYKITDDGISERLIPGAAGVFYQANSYEHDETSHTTEQSKARREQVEKRNKKSQTYLANHFARPTVYGDIDSEIVLVSWGGTKGVILDTQKALKAEGKATAFIHFTHLFPLDREVVRSFFPPGKRYILIENNSQGQFGRLLQMEIGIEISEKILKYDGRPLWVEDIIKHII